MAHAHDGEKVDVLAYLQKQLLANGYLARPLDISALPEPEAHKLERCLSALLSKATDDQTHQANLAARYRQLASEVDRLEGQVHRDRTSLDASEKEREQAKARAALAVKELEREAARHALAKEEASKARLALGVVKTTATQEGKRRENELAARLARWQKVSSAGVGAGTGACITLLNGSDGAGVIGRASPNRAAGARTGRDSPSAEVRLLEESLSHLEDARVTVQEENKELREVVHDIVNEIHATLAAIDVTDARSLGDIAAGERFRIPAPHLTLAPHDLTEYLSKLLIILRDAAVSTSRYSREEVDALREQHATTVSKEVRELEESLAAMQRDLDEARAQADEAQAALNSLQAERAEEAQVAGAALDKERSELARKRKKIESEGQKLSQAATAMKQEREAFDRERLAFLEERRAALEAEAKRKEEKRRKQTQQRDAVHAGMPEVEARENSSEQASIPLREKPSSQTLKPIGGTSSALQSILAAASDTPPMRALQPNLVGQGRLADKANKARK